MEGTSDDSSTPPPKPKPSSRFKGVVPQANGHWGAQIYANHNRIWLGTFKTEDLAGAAYDSAAIKLRHGNAADPHRNFPLNDFTCHEAAFQAHYTTEQILNMIKDGSYQKKFYEFLQSAQVNGVSNSSFDNTETSKDGYHRVELFRKELTLSDVGKLNRLVIPKRYALKYFNPEELGLQDFGVEKEDGNRNGNGDGDGGGFELTFYDKSMRSWKFKYCFWKSSSSYVFTRGWNGFVKVKKLKEKDTVVFYDCRLMGNNDVVTRFYMIDVLEFSSSEGVSSVVDESVVNQSTISNHDESEEENDENGENINEGDIYTKGFKLFGVKIVPQNCNMDR